MFKSNDVCTSMLDATTYLGGEDRWRNHRRCNQMQTIGCATITSGALIFIEGANNLFEQHNHNYESSETIIFGGATVGDATKCKRLVAQP